MCRGAWGGVTRRAGLWEAPPGMPPGFRDSRLCPQGERVGALREAKKIVFFST